MDSSKVLRKVLLHPGQFVIPRRIYRDCRGLDAEGTLVRMNELVDEGLGTLIQRTQQQTVFYKALPTLDIEDLLRNHGIELDEYHAKFFETDFKISESHRLIIHNKNPEKDYLQHLLESSSEGEQQDDEEQEDDGEQEEDGDQEDEGEQDDDVDQEDEGEEEDDGEQESDGEQEDNGEQEDGEEKE